MGKIIKFPGKFQPPPPPTPEPKKKKNLSSFLWSLAGTLCYWTFVAVFSVLFAILLLIAKALLWMLLATTAISFLAMIIMWDQPTYVPMVVFIVSFGICVGGLVFITQYEPEGTKGDKDKS